MLHCCLHSFFFPGPSSHNGNEEGQVLLNWAKLTLKCKAIVPWRIAFVKWTCRNQISCQWFHWMRLNLQKNTSFGHNGNPCYPHPNPLYAAKDSHAVRFKTKCLSRGERFLLHSRRARRLAILVQGHRTIFRSMKRIRPAIKLDSIIESFVCSFKCSPILVRDLWIALKKKAGLKHWIVKNP